MPARSTHSKTESVDRHLADIAWGPIIRTIKERLTIIGTRQETDDTIFSVSDIDDITQEVASQVLSDQYQTNHQVDLDDGTLEAIQLTSMYTHLCAILSVLVEKVISLAFDPLTETGKLLMNVARLHEARAQQIEHTVVC